MTIHKFLGLTIASIPGLSCPDCSDEDVVTVPNIPLFGAFEKVSGQSQVVKGMLWHYLVQRKFLPCA
jgi:hypothetical protein